MRQESGTGELSVKMRNCYGIRKLDHSFIFRSESLQAYSVYAPNGFMKSSFAKTFKDLSENQDSSDTIFPDRETTREIIFEGESLKADQVFVIKPYDDSFHPKSSAQLLVNKELKKKYDKIATDIDVRKKDLISALKASSGLAGRAVSIETELCQCFGRKKADFVQVLRECYEAEQADSRFEGLKLADIFNSKTEKILSSEVLLNSVEEYIATYNRLIENSPILTKEFHHQNAGSLSKGLKDSGFFTANHSLNLADGDNSRKISRPEDFEEVLKKEQEQILKDENLKKQFQTVDRALSNNETRTLRSLISERKDLLPELKNQKALRQKLWTAYVNKHKELTRNYLHEYLTSRSTVEGIIKQAQEERTNWVEVVEKFNNRFNVPFRLRVENQDEVILQNSAPSIVFEFEESSEKAGVSREDLLKVLSQGEQRALYILNILFEVETRKTSNPDTLFIVDDIADSFDYKNKYSIVEYLRDLVSTSNFKTIFLTHNFDFHRTLSGRLDIPRMNRLVAIKTDYEVQLAQEVYQKDPLKHWKRHLANNPSYTISCIPFARNLADYCGETQISRKLTSLLHVKPDSDSILLQDLQRMYKSVFRDLTHLSLPNPTKRVNELIFDQAESIVSSGVDRIELEDKIITSIAIRLLAEKIMILRINDQAFVDQITEHQTRKLIDRFRSDFEDENDTIALLEQVNLMTPENIHLNSFMYEPILDMSASHLFKLYQDLRILQQNQVTGLEQTAAN